MEHNCHKGNKDKLKNIYNISLRNTRKRGKNLEDPTKGGGVVQEDNHFKIIKAQYVDSAKKRSTEGVDIDEILHHSRGSIVGNERLEGGMEGSRRTSQKQAANRSEIFIEE
jgi:hypothetical protein